MVCFGVGELLWLLVVDDNLVVGELFECMVGVFGWCVDCVGSGSEVVVWV